jgi:hypothetical protein
MDDTTQGVASQLVGTQKMPETGLFQNIGILELDRTIGSNQVCRQSSE